MRVIVEQLPDDHIALHLPKDITDEGIDDLIRQIMPKVMKSEKGCVCAFFGYEFDERELFQIPEAIETTKRLVDRGFISMMHVSTLMDNEEKPYLAKVFGAMEIWAMATGNLTADGNLTMDEDLIKLFFVDLDKANKKAKLTVLPIITDGQHRTKV